MNILLDFLFKISVIEPTPAASTAFLKQVCVVVDPTSEAPAGTIVEVTSIAELTALNLSAGATAEITQLFSAGMSKVHVLPVANLDLSQELEGHESDFYTVLISSDFSDAEVTPTAATGNVTITSYANLVSGTDDSVTINGVVFTAQAGAATPGTATFQAATDNDTTAESLAAQINAHESVLIDGVLTASVVGAVVTITADTAGAAGNAITLVYTDNDTNVGATVSGAVLTGGDGLILGEFEGVVGLSSATDSFLDDYAATANYVAFHTTTGNKAQNMFYAFGKLLSGQSWSNQQYITMPLADDVDTLGDAETLFDDKISFVMNDDEYGKRLALFAVGGKAIIAPYVLKNLRVDMQSTALSFISGNQPQYTLKAAALLEDSLQSVIDSYISQGLMTAGTVEVLLEEDNFVATGNINVATPTAMWRISGEMRQTL
jgi:hypothetical protein